MDLSIERKLDGIEIDFGQLSLVNISLSFSRANVKKEDVMPHKIHKSRLRFPAQASIQVLNFELHLDVPNSGRNCYIALGAPLFLRLKFSESLSFV